MRRKRDNLEQITAFERTIAKADSLSRIMKMSKEEQRSYFQKHIDSLKQHSQTSGAATITDFGRKVAQEYAPSQEGGFYFYSPQTVAYGKQLFKQQFGDRPLSDNWRWSNQWVAQQSSDTTSDSLEQGQAVAEKYLKQLPSSQELIALEKERETALYGLGELYWDKFADGKLAQQRLTRLLTLTQNDKLKEKTLYLLYKINEEKNPKEAETYKQQLLASYPNSEYAKPLLGQVSTNEKELDAQYQALEKQLEAQQFQEVLTYIDSHKSQYKTSSQAPDWDLLRAKAIARLEGKDAYIRALEAIVQEYPNTTQTDDLQDKLKILKAQSQKPTFLTDEEASSWKLVVENMDATQQQRLKDYLEENGFAYITLSQDVYNDKEQLLVLHGFMSRQMAEGFVQRVNNYFQTQAKEKNQEKNRFFKEFFVISSENYAILQVYKNKDEYIKNN